MRQLQALRVMLDEQSVFLTGAPGSGKTYVINEFVKRAEASGKRVAVTASTGIAATQIGGLTIHSWSGLGIKDVLKEWDLERLSANERLVKRYNSTDVLVIDEVSMLQGSRLDMLNQVCKLLRKNPRPFGGLQLIMSGDLFQLPPISKGEEAIDFIYKAKAWEELEPKICYLTGQHRQTDSGLLDILNAMRRGEVTQDHEALLRGRLTTPSASQPAITRLYSHNVDVEAINQRQLEALEGRAKTYFMETSGQTAKIEQLAKSVLAPKELQLKVGAEVMFVANDFTKGLVNGSRGQVVDFSHGLPLVRLNQQRREITVEPHSWVLSEDDRQLAEVSQLPLRLAWAITIHKSQGMSLDAAEIDLSKSFSPGMGYVALSRVRSLEGVYLLGVNRYALQMHPDIYELDEKLRQASAELAAKTADLTASKTKVKPTPPQVVDEELFIKLKEWRLKKALSLALPAFIIAHNRVLEAIAIEQPNSAEALIKVKGFGQKKFDAFGEELIELINRHSRVPLKR